MSPCCCSLVSENKEKWLMLPCYCYIIYTSNLFLWLITGLVRYIGNVKRCGRSYKSVYKTVQNVYVYNLEENLHKVQLLSGLIICVSTSDCSWIHFSLSRPLSLDWSKAFLEWQNPLSLTSVNNSCSYLLGEPRVNMWFLLTWVHRAICIAPQITVYINHHRAVRIWAINLSNHTQLLETGLCYLLNGTNNNYSEVAGCIYVVDMQVCIWSCKNPLVMKWPKWGLHAEASV